MPGHPDPSLIREFRPPPGSFERFGNPAEVSCPQQVAPAVGFQRGADAGVAWVGEKIGGTGGFESSAGKPKNILAWRVLQGGRGSALRGSTRPVPHPPRGPSRARFLLLLASPPSPRSAPDVTVLLGGWAPRLPKEPLQGGLIRVRLNGCGHRTPDGPEAEQG